MATNLKRKVENDDSFKRVEKKPRKMGIEGVFKDFENASRTEQRKAVRKLKKLRKDAFMRKEEIPTLESLKKKEEEKDKIRHKIMRNRARQRRRKKNKRTRMIEEKEEKERKDREAETLNLHDNKELRALEKKLKFRKDKSLPRSFKDDCLGYVLDYMEEAKACMEGQGHEADEEEGLGEKDEASKKKKPASTKADYDDEDEGDFGDDDDEEEDHNDDGMGKKSSVKKNGSKKVHFDIDEEDDDEEEEEESEEDDDDGEVDDDDDAEGDHGSDSVEEGDEEYDEDEEEEEDPSPKTKVGKTSALEKNKAEKSEGKEKRTTAGVGDYVPLALRRQQDEGQAEVGRQVVGILNELSEVNMERSCNKFEQLFKDHSRQSVCSALENGISMLCLTEESCSRLLLIHCSFLTAFLHARVGIEVSARVLQFVVKRLCDLYEASRDDDQNESEEINNCLLLLCQLYDFKVMDSVLVLDVVKRFLKRFYVNDVKLIMALLKEVGPRMRKDDPVAFKELLVEIMERSGKVSEEASTMKKLLVKNLIDLLTVLKNNQFHKVPSYDPDAFKKRSKLFSHVAKSSAVIPLKVSLDDIEQCETRGKWWLVGTAWSGRGQDAPNEPQRSSSSSCYKPAVVAMAKSIRMDSGTKMDIFCTMMSAKDQDEAYENIMRLNLGKEQQSEIMHVIVTTCVQGQRLNPFYAHLAAKFCRYHKRFIMACKCSLWDKIKMIPKMEKIRIDRLTEFMKFMLEWEVIPLTVLKKVHFAGMDPKTGTFVGSLLTHVLTQCKNFPRIFRAVSYDDSFKPFRLGLELFLEMFFIENRGGETAADEGLVRRARKALEVLAEPHVKTDGRTESNEDDLYLPEGDSADDD